MVLILADEPTVAIVRFVAKYNLRMFLVAIPGTQAVVGKHLDDPTLTDTPMAAFPDHAGQLTSQCHQPCDAVLNLNKVPPSDDVHLGTRTIRLGGERQKLPDGLDLKPELARMANES
jgi:hypothetical protein